MDNQLEKKMENEMGHDYRPTWLVWASGIRPYRVQGIRLVVLGFRIFRTTLYRANGDQCGLEGCFTFMMKPEPPV